MKTQSRVVGGSNANVRLIFCDAIFSFFAVLMLNVKTIDRYESLNVLDIFYIISNLTYLLISLLMRII